MEWARILAYVTGTVDQELLARNEYLAAENRILKAQLNGRLKLSDAGQAEPNRCVNLLSSAGPLISSTFPLCSAPDPPNPVESAANALSPQSSCRLGVRP